MAYSISRRDFLKGTAAGALTLAATGIFGGAVASAEEAKEKWVPEEELDCDLLVIGAGASGLAACVEAAEAGAKVICIESQSTPGGGAKGVEGIFAVGSQMQKAIGYETSMGALIRNELTSGQFRNNGVAYIDMVHQSGANVDWLIAHGVSFGELFSGDRANPDRSKIYHCYTSGAGAVDYVVPMVAAAEAAGVTFYYNTKGQSLIKNADGRVCGVYATDENEKCIQINASSVIMATGGFAANKEMMSQFYANLDDLKYMGFPGSDGSGNAMVLEAGGVSNVTNTAIQGTICVKGLPSYFANGVFSFMIGVIAPYAVWVNDDAVRFVNEDFSMPNPMLSTIPGRAYKHAWILMDQAQMDLYLTGKEEAGLKELEDALASGEMFKAETVEGLATAINLDPEKLGETIAHYNEACEAGDDDYFGKDPQFLMPFENGPFYAIHPTYEALVTCGSVKTNNRFQAVDKDNNAIEGLYVIGVEGTMLWANTYTMEVAGSCNANNVNSGRRAAQYALAELKA